MDLVMIPLLALIINIFSVVKLYSELHKFLLHHFPLSFTLHSTTSLYAAKLKLPASSGLTVLVPVVIPRQASLSSHKSIT
jgi:hypothetical protein